MSRIPLNELRRHPTSRRIVASWRALVRGADSARTIVACSGGADSTALALALAASKLDLRIAHILHDLRPREEAEADRDAVRVLAESLGLAFDEGEISIGPGNAESQARRLRYQALARIARDHKAPFIASAHHADDQLETMIMALLRGAGPRGMRGVAPRRVIGPGVQLIRPMLRVTHDQAIELCQAGGARWREDATNLDTSRLRSALRQGPLAQLRELRPKGALKAARTAELLREASALVDERAAEIFGAETTWPRDILRNEPAVVLGAGLRAAALRLTEGARADALTAKVLDPAIRAIRDDSTEPRSFDWPAGLCLRATAREVVLSLMPDA